MAFVGDRSLMIATQSVLGKRTIRDIYYLTQPVAGFQHNHVAIRRAPSFRFHATEVAQHKPQDYGPPPSSKRPPPPPASKPKKEPPPRAASQPKTVDQTSASFQSSKTEAPPDWEENPDLSISNFSELPSKDFGFNQHMVINEEFKEALRQILWKFRAPIRYAFAYGSGVFPQAGGSSSSSKSCHPSPPQAIEKVQTGGPKMIDFIFGVSYTQHWHSLNLNEHRDHYSTIGSFGSYPVSLIQDKWGAGVYFNPYITVNGTLIKYGVVNLDTLCQDLSTWDTLYIAGRLQKPVKILRDHPSVRLANQVNLISAVRTALLLLPPDFTEQQLYGTIAGISYMGDPRFTAGAENPQKVANIVSGQLANFRRLYAPLIENLPNVSFNDPQTRSSDWIDNPEVNAKVAQDMDPVKRGNMVRRLPAAFREKLYFEYQAKFHIPRGQFNKMLQESKDEDPTRIKRREGGEFEQRIGKDVNGIKKEVSDVIKKTISGPALSQSVKGVVTSGFSKSWRYLSEKREKNKASKQKAAEKEAAEVASKQKKS